jgi:molybdopterin adenylyltransferase
LSNIKIGVITVSDRASAGIYEDISGKAIIETLNEYLNTQWIPEYRLVPDEMVKISDAIVELCDKFNCNLIVTTGGTGPTKRDITPEATERVCHKIMHGFGEEMRRASLKTVPTAILSRQIACIRESKNSSLIINLPGKPKAIRECLDAVFPAVPYCIDLIGGYRLETNEMIIKAFRPKNS